MKKMEQSQKEQEAVLQKEALYRIMNLSSKLVEAIPKNNDDFLWELLELGLNSVQEADYGSISIIDHGTWRFAAAIGHDWQELQKLALKPEYSLQLEEEGHSISSNVYVIDGILDEKIEMPSKLQKKLVEASKPIKQTLVAKICFNGVCKGHFCLDIAAGSSKTFGEDAFRVIKPIGDLASAYLMMRETYCLVDDLEQVVNNRTQAVRNLLDNVGQGLLTFGKDYAVHLDYSYECQRIFGTGIEAQAFPRLIYPDNKEEAGFVEQILQEVFHCNDAYKTGVYLSLLPKEILYDGRYINLEYKMVKNIYSPSEKAVMVLITEITERRRLEDQIKEDAQVIRMVATVAGNFTGFMECVKEFQYFYGSKLHEIIERNQSVSAIYADVFREIHTYKGSFSQFEMQSSVENLGAMETALAYIGSNLSSFTRKELCAFIYSFDIIDFLNKDIEILREKLGSHFLSMGEMIYVEKRRLYEIEKEVIQTCSPMECRVLLPLIKRLKYKSFKEMMSTYPDYTVKLAERLEKPINAFSIAGDDLLVDSEKYSAFVKALVHIFRNCVDHGLEGIEKRLEFGKPEIGNISCTIHNHNNQLEICIEDDGGGINFDQIRVKAVACGLFSEEQAQGMEEKALIDLIYRDSFTTKDKITDVSGRGMGLSAVKYELEKLGGTIEVYTEKNKGTIFRMHMPIIEPEQKEDLAAQTFLQPILTTTMDFLKEHIGEGLTIRSIVPICSNSITLKNYSAKINIRGLFDGAFSISMDHNMSEALLNSMVYETVREQYVTKYKKDVLAECANIILGNSINAYMNIEELIIIGTPSVMYSASGDIDFEGSEINGFSICTNKGDVVISIMQ